MDTPPSRCPTSTSSCDGHYPSSSSQRCADADPAPRHPSTVTVTVTVTEADCGPFTSHCPHPSSRPGRLRITDPAPARHHPSVPWSRIQKRSTTRGKEPYVRCSAGSREPGPVRGVPGAETAAHRQRPDHPRTAGRAPGGRRAHTRGGGPLRPADRRSRGTAAARHRSAAHGAEVLRDLGRAGLPLPPCLPGGAHRGVLVDRGRPQRLADPGAGPGPARCGHQFPPGAAVGPSAHSGPRDRSGLRPPHRDPAGRAGTHHRPDRDHPRARRGAASREPGPGGRRGPLLPRPRRPLRLHPGAR